MNTNRVGIAFLVGALLWMPVAHGQTLSRCQQKVDYQLKPPMGDVAAEFKAFWGVWVGSWKSGQICSALIVEEVKKDGSVETEYVWGSNPSFGIRDPGKRPRTGKIEKGVLVLPGGPQLSTVEYHLVHGTELDATYSYGRTSASGVFMRQQ